MPMRRSPGFLERTRQGGGSRFGLLLGMALVSSLVPGEAGADIFSFVDANGVVHLTDSPNDPRYRLLVSTRRRPVTLPRQPVVQEPRSYVSLGMRGLAAFRETIHWAAGRYRLNPALVMAVIKAESNFDPNAVSRAGAVGLMQLMPETALQYGVLNRRDPVSNIHAGTRHLADLLVKFDNDLSLSLAAYNAGENAVRRAGNRIPAIQETREYVSRVLDYYRRYREYL
ncbi:MAG: transglycosylase SLT domain-containing protein [Magnetococcales bacterium]|nr:transglycosylase SLT domain-containing protein [Magnetococcales bacterium]